MGCCLEALLEVILPILAMDFFFPWLNPEPDSGRYARVYGICAIVLLALGVFCRWILHPAQNTGLTVTYWTAFILGGYFAVLALCYWQVDNRE